MPPKKEAAPYFNPVGDVLSSLGGLFSDGKGGGGEGKPHYNIGNLCGDAPKEWTYPQWHSLPQFCQWMCDANGVSRAVVLVPLFLILLVIESLLVPNFLSLAVGWLLITAPLWAPIAIGMGWWRVWVWYILSYTIARRPRVLLEIKIPREITKSPRAMEAVMTELWVTSGQTTWLDRNWDGRRRPWFSLEMASFGGETHFYIWTFKDQRDLVELNMYAQYPEIEIVEAEDYSQKFVYDPAVYDCFANQMYMLHDPEGILPIRTYLDYELEKDPKDEHKVDPMAQVVELLSAGRKSEQMWIQIIFHCMTEGGAAAFRARCQGRIEQLRLQGALFGPDVHLTPEQERVARARPSWRQMEQMQAIERHMNKRMFEVGIRISYIAKYEDYRPAIRNALRWVFMPYYAQWMNNLRPKRWHGDFDFPWQDYKGIRWRLIIRRHLDAWRRRSYMYAPWQMPPLPMSTEAIASLWHPPARSIASPGLERIAAKKSEPPANLPR